ncbi:uncharacterized protein LOC108041642 [Drosophila rhopaloa]|uniref:Uncharacterized protein n=2 Tax=Drosophila rhopaloa TaxID=1041015 RepID=A0ABM5H604_DRORH|nr:uncharacterized protein LOC108041642 [Drosophila rhopaloa]
MVFSKLISPGLSEVYNYLLHLGFYSQINSRLYKIRFREPRESVDGNRLSSAFSITNRKNQYRITMKFFSVVTVFVLGLLALANAVPLSPDPGNVIILTQCRGCNVRGN